MEKYAAEMKVVNVSLNIRYYTGVCDAISTGLGRNKLLEQVAIRGVQREDRVCQIKAIIHENCSFC